MQFKLYKCMEKLKHQRKMNWFHEFDVQFIHKCTKAK